MPPSYVRPNPITGRYPDEVHRIADDINTVLAQEKDRAIGEWMIFGLDDGKPAMDNAAWKHKHYPTPHIAINDWKSLRVAILFKIPAMGAHPRDVAAWLQMNRQAHDAGYRITNGTYDPTERILAEMPLNREDFKL